MSIASSIDGEKTGINLLVTYRVIFVTTVSIPRLTSCGDYGPIISSNLPRSAWIESRKGVWESIGAVIQDCAGIHEHINIKSNKWRDWILLAPSSTISFQVIGVQEADLSLGVWRLTWTLTRPIAHGWIFNSSISLEFNNTQRELGIMRVALVTRQVSR
jgi:hypothetical protein